MRHQPLLARIAFGAFLIGALIALAACAGTRAGLWPLAVGLNLLIPGLAIGVIGFGSDLLLERLGRKLFPWDRSRTA